MNEKLAELWALSLYYQYNIYIIKKNNYVNNNYVYNINSNKYELTWYISPEHINYTNNHQIIEVLTWRDFGFPSIDTKYIIQLKNILINKYLKKI